MPPDSRAPADIATAKAAARYRAQQRRRAIPETMRQAARSAVTQSLLALIGETLLPERSAVRVAGYYPIGTELDVLPALKALSAGDARITLSLPVPIAAATPLRFRRWHPEAAVVREDRFGTFIPSAEQAEVTPDIILVPMLAWNRHGYRLGYGGGFYDRTLARIRADMAIGVAFEQQYDPQLPVDANDMPLTALVTPERVYQFSSPKRCESYS